MPHETVKIASDETESGYIIINKSDFDSAHHKPYDADAIAAEKAKAKAEKGAKPQA